MREKLIEVRNLRFAYRDKPVLKGISFDVATGDTLSVLGANGSGKSTLLRIMLGFLKFEGEVLIGGKSVRDYGKRELASLVAYVPQTHYPRHAKFVSSLTLFLKDGKILAFGRSEQLINAQNIDKIYGITYKRYEDRL